MAEIEGKEEAGKIAYRDWTIWYEPPPIPIRTMDWTYSHNDYDGPPDRRYGYASSVAECKADIDEIEQENAA